METYIHENFDLPALLTMDAVNVRRLAQEFPALSVEQFFDALTAFVRLVPFAKKALDNIADFNGEKEDFKIIDEMAQSLESIGSGKFIADFHSLLSENTNIENLENTARHAKKLTKPFAEFCSQISATKRESTIEVLPFAAMPLREYIIQLDVKEVSDAAMSLKTPIQEPDVQEPDVRGPDVQEPRRKRCILAVDDSPAILSSVSSVLGDYKVFTLPKPTELVNVLKKLTPDLFLLDYLMPVLNGFELVPIIRSFEKHKDTPIIFLTSAGTLDNVTAAIAVGARDFIVKPFHPDVLREKVARHIGVSAAES